MIHSNGYHPDRPVSRTLLAAEGLRKAYGPRVALRELTFALDAGHVLGFLGPNGAGKTTAIRILTTILEPTAGTFTVDGVGHQHPEEIRRKIGVLPESLGFPKQSTGIEYLTFFGQLYGLSAAEARERGTALLEEVGLRQRARSLIGTYSRGMRQRIGIARALINEPVVVFLDEPTLGLDPRGQQELLALVQRIARERNVGVVLCSHLLSEIEGVCDDVVILSSGQVVAAGPVADVVRQARSSSMRVHVPAAQADAARQALAALPGIRVTPVDTRPGWLTVAPLDGAGAPPDEGDQLKNHILEALIRADIPVLAFEADGGRLQDIFLQVTEEGIR